MGCGCAFARVPERAESGQEISTESLELKMDYTQLSDYEINKAIALKLNPAATDFCKGEGESTWFTVSTYSENRDYCNNPSDAWPIIIKNRIHIDPPLKDFLPWKADRGVAFECTHENPLRAAMIVFLKLKEHEC